MTTEPLFAQYKPRTKNNFMLDEVASTLQKAIRRGDEKLALFFALELFPKYAAYAWRRLQVVSVEDIESPNACVYVNSMRDAFFFNNKDVKNAEDFKNRIFITKAVISLCREVKSREADHAQAYIDQIVESNALPEIPKYAFDVHTKSGRLNGATKSSFFKDEQKGLDIKGKDEYYKKVNL